MNRARRHQEATRADREMAASTAVKVAAAPPSLDDLEAWLAIANSEAPTGHRMEDILTAHDHFRRLGGKQVKSPEYALARALLDSLVREARAMVNQRIPLRGLQKSEQESARLTAMAYVSATITDAKATRYTPLREFFSANITFLCKDSLVALFGRSDDHWRDPKLRAGLDVDHGVAIGVGRNDASKEGGDNSSKIADFLDRCDLEVDPHSLSDLQLALSTAIEELPTEDHKLIALWSYLGYTPTELAPIFGVTPPTITNRLQVLAQSPHLQAFHVRG